MNFHSETIFSEMNIWPNAIYIKPKLYDITQILILICAFNLAGNGLHIPPEPTSFFIRAASSVDGSE